MDFFKENAKSAFNKLYETAVHGLPGCNSIEEEITEIHKDSPSMAVDDLIDRQITIATLKSATLGFVSGAGGALTLPIALPMEMIGTLYTNLRLSLIIASLSGHAIHGESVRLFAQLALLGDSAKELIKTLSTQLGARLTITLAQQLSGKVVLDVQNRVLEEIVVRLGFQTTNHFTRWLPLVSGSIASVIDGVFTYKTGQAAKRIFLPYSQFRQLKE